MTAFVGGRMETVEPRRSLFGPDYVRLATLVAVSLVVHLWLVDHTAVTARDGVGFARYALGIQSPESAGPHNPRRTFVDVIRAEKHPPGFPLAVWITAKFVRKSTTLPLPDSTLLATQLVSVMAACLLVVPMYILGRMLFGRNIGFAAALLFQVLPVPAHVTSDGLTEATYLLPAVTALMLGVRAVRRPGVGGFLLCGLATGACYLVRPEGLMVGGAVGLVAGWLGLTRRWPRDLAAGRLAGLGVGVALIAAPYMILIGSVTNKPTLKDTLDRPGGGASRLIGESHSRLPAPTSGPLLARFWTHPEGGPVAVVTPAITATLQETGKGLHYGAAALALVGLFALRRRIAADPGLTVLVVLLGVNTAAAIWLGIRGYDVNDMRVHYVSERHVILIVLLGCLFATVGAVELGRAFSTDPTRSRVAAAAILGVLVATALPATFKPLHAHRVAHKHAGEWLRERLREHGAREEPVVVLDPFEWAAYYSEWTLHQVPQDSRDARVRYTILDNKNHADDHARLLRMKHTRLVASGGQPVYWWPENVPVEQAQVVVYKTVGPSQNEIEGKPFGSQK